MNTYNVIWENGNTTKFKTFQNLDSVTLKQEFEKLSNIRVSKIEKIDVLESFIVEKSKEVNFMFSYTIYDNLGNPFYYNRNIIPEFKSFGSKTGLESAMRSFKNIVFGESAIFNNGCMTSK